MTISSGTLITFLLGGLSVGWAILGVVLFGFVSEIIGSRYSDNTDKFLGCSVVFLWGFGTSLLVAAFMLANGALKVAS